LGTQQKTVVTNAPWSELTYQIIGLVMALFLAPDFLALPVIKENRQVRG
jgi:hypothetical protein